MGAHGVSEDPTAMPPHAGFGAPPPHAHLTQFYVDDAALLDALVPFISQTLMLGNAALILATEAHRNALAARLHTRGLDIATAADEGRYLALDARDLLARLMRDGAVDREAASAILSDLIDQAAAAVSHDYARLAVFGEVVALLSAAGNHAAAIALERLWNDLLATRPFTLLCAYPMGLFPQTGDGEAFGEICAAHTRVVPTEDYTMLEDDAARLRSVALLQQKAQALEAEITERTRAQDLLQRREAELANFIEEAPVALHWVGPDGVIIWANRAELELLGYAREAYVGRPIAEFHADQATAADILERLARHETLHDYEARLRRQDGSLLYVLINSNVHWQDGEFLHTRCVTRDITERVQAGDARAHLAAIIDSSHDAVIGKTLEGTITSWNRAAQRLYGYTPEEIIGQPIATIVPPERYDELAEIMAQVASGKALSEFSSERVRKDGSRVEVSLSISPIRGHAGRIIGAATIARDITQRRALERQKQEFMEMVAHDLGSPLTVIRGYAQLLQRRQAYDERAVAAIVSETARMGRLVTDMLEVARLEAGQLELRRTEIDLTALARNCVAQAAMVASGCLVQVEAPEQPIAGQWDGDRLAQVITNLLDNALKYAPGSAITVQVTSCAEEAEVAVVDHGPGLTTAELQHIFDHYSRGVRAAGAAGTGLGLFISHGVITAHGGRLWAESEPGRGSTFHFTLPYADSATP